VAGRFVFDRYVLDMQERRLTADGEPLDLNSRYLDGLALLVRCRGQLVPKDRFLGEVWRGIPVTDEALTQCIRTLRRQLGDDAAHPRFIETVPKHGYRFIAAVEPLEDPHATIARTADRWPTFVRTAIAGTAGAGVAGLIGGLVYGLAGASDRLQPAEGALSVLLVLLAVTFLVALIGGAGVSLGIGATRLVAPRSWAWTIAGGAAGGFFVGAFGKLLGLDAFGLLVGQSPGNITGGSEGLVVGAAVGLGVCLADFAGSLQRGVIAAAGSGATTGLVISVLGGRLMLGSLDLLTRHLTQSRLRLDEIGSLFGEQGLGSVTLAVSASLECGLFAACIVAAMRFAERR
jgi:DNA-binding winged helix-turn-helix (wHTH) protein